MCLMLHQREQESFPKSSGWPPESHSHWCRGLSKRGIQRVKFGEAFGAAISSVAYHIISFLLQCIKKSII